VLGSNGHGAAYERWLETNIREQKQTGYAMVTVKVPQGNLTGTQMHALAQISRSAGDGLLRVTVDQNLVLAYIPLRALPQVYKALEAVELAESGVHEIEDVITCPGAYSCNLALTKSMNLGAAVAPVVREYTDPLVRQLSIKVSGCPNSCGQHWIGDIGFYGNARKIGGRGSEKRAFLPHRAGGRKIFELVDRRRSSAGYFQDRRRPQRDHLGVSRC
jgi:sulfite reductase beta subunit-like hemoprotein